MTTWQECYESSWSGFIVPDAYAHPAKFSRALIERILDHCLERGWIKRGDVIADPFGGIGTGGVIAAYRGLAWVGIEIEPRFCVFANRNFELHKDRWQQLGVPMPRIIQGDSRRFHELVNDGVSATITSPPYADTVNSKQHGIDWSKMDPKSTGNRKRGEGTKHAETLNNQLAYGCADGQIGSLKAGCVDGCITSPPYAGAGEVLGSHNGIDFSKAKEGGKRATEARKASGENYGSTAGQIGALKSGPIDLVVTSPPYSDIAAGQGGLNTKPPKHPGQQSGRTATLASQNSDQRYGATEGQISKLKGGSVDAVVTSPPYQEAHIAQDMRVNMAAYGTGKDLCRDQGPNYGATSGQIGQLKGGTVDGVVKHLTVTEANDGSNLCQQIGARNSVVQTGSNPDRKPSNEMGIAALTVEGESDSTFTMKKRRKKPVGHGITRSTILPRSVNDATQSGTPRPDQPGSISASTAAEPSSLAEGNVEYAAATNAGKPTSGTPKSPSDSELTAPGFAVSAGDQEEHTKPNTAAHAGQTYWQAVNEVYQSCYRAIKPGGIMVVVIKDYIRKKQRVPLCDDTARLLEHIGFEPLERVHAMLVKEKRHADLFEGETVETKSRKSFFRRLAESNGSPRIDFEEVLFFRKPSTERSL